MVFSSLTFLFFFLPILYILIFASRNKRWRNGVLIGMSLLFYGWGEPVWILAMLFSTAVNFVCSRMIASTEDIRKRRQYLIVGVVTSVCFLFYFKYSAFLLNSVTALLGIDFRIPTPVLPIGISFYTFQILTYTVDVYRGKSKALNNPMKLLLYISCFPQLIAGPIVQYSDVADQLDEREICADDFSDGMKRFSFGLAKKVMLANICGAILEELNLAGTGVQMSVVGAWLATFMYTLQIYFDFSAYSDMAIGLGKALGFTYKENFNYPYVSASITEFWRRWHISLGSFFRDYVYIPMGGNRCGKTRTAFNMLVVWSLTGLWHGASWNFVLWGAYYGLLLLTERFVLNRILDRIPSMLRRLGTFIVVMIGWVLFYYTDLSAVMEHLRAMAGIPTLGIAVPLMDPVTVAVLRKYTVLPFVAFLLCLPIVPRVRTKLGSEEGTSIWWRYAESVLAVTMFAASVLFLVGQTYNPFIYFRF